jgi:hypothetical protein
MKKRLFAGRKVDKMDETAKAVELALLTGYRSNK